jgi:hypothetical protein
MNFPTIPAQSVLCLLCGCVATTFRESGNGRYEVGDKNEERFSVVAIIAIHHHHHHHHVHHTEAQELPSGTGHIYVCKSLESASPWALEAAGGSKKVTGHTAAFNTCCFT